MTGALLLVFFNHPNKLEIVCLSIPVSACFTYAISGLVIKRGVSVVSNVLRVVGLMVACSLGVILYAWHFWPAPPPAPEPVPISFRLGCEFSRIPIHIPSSSTIHVIQIRPGLLIPTSSKPNFLDQGSFFNISADEDKARDWPAKQDGKLMTRKQVDDWFKEGGKIPSFWAFKCTMTSYTSQTLDEIVAVLVIDTTDKKQYSYRIPFDPIMSSKSYTFWVVNICSFGEVPEAVQWDDKATVHVLGEEKSREVPLRFEKMNWPSQLMPLGPSLFIWNGVGECKWNQ